MAYETLAANDYQAGRYNATSGSRQGQSSTAYICTKDYLPSGVAGVSVADGYKVGIHVWDMSKDPVEHIGMITSTGIRKNSGADGQLAEPTDLTRYPDTYKYKLDLFAPSDGAVTPSSGYDKISLGYKTDKTLSIDGVPADAKAVGGLLDIEYIDIATTENDWAQGGITIATGNENTLSTRIRMTVPDRASSAEVLNGADIKFIIFGWAGDVYQGRWIDGEFTTTSGSTLGYYHKCDFAPIYATGTTEIVVVAMGGTNNNQSITPAVGINIKFVKIQTAFDRVAIELTKLSTESDFNLIWTSLNAYDFEKGSFSTITGATRISASTVYMRTSSYLPDNVCGVKSVQDYKIAVYVWDTKDDVTYIGTITDTGIRSSSGADQWRTDYVDLRQYPATYKYKVVLTHADETTNVSIPVDYVNLLAYTQKIGIPVRSPYNHGPYDIYKERFVDWYSGQQASYTAEGFGENTTYAQVIAAFDGLVTLDPVYVSKVKLGTTSGTVSRPEFDYDGEQYSYDIWEYVFKPKNYAINLNYKKVPKIYMDAAMHGFEKGGTYGAYYFLKDLITKWEEVPVLSAIRQSAEIHVIPVSNPWGFDHNTYQNGQGININRNFSFNGEWTIRPAWDTNASGNAPFDQVESQIIRDWLIAAEPDLMLYANLHAYGRNSATGYANMNTCFPIGDSNDDYYDRFIRVLVNHINEQTLRWPKMYAAVQPGPDVMLGNIRVHTEAANEPVRGQAAWWASSVRKIVALTLEVINGLTDDGVTIIPSFTGDAWKIDSESIGNMINQTLREYGE